MAGNFRVTTYELRAGEFTGTTYTLTLDQNLVSNYFVMVNPGGPDQNNNFAARITADPFGTGALGVTTNPNELYLARQDSADGDWLGSIVVIECLANPTTAGFTLLDVLVTTATNPASPGVQTTIDNTSAANFTSNTVPFGGIYGGGLTVNEAGTGRYSYVAQLNVDIANNELDIIRYDSNGNDLPDATYTTYMVDWGSDWTVQTAVISGGSTNSIDVTALNAWATEPLSIRVKPTKTWVWGTTYFASTSTVSSGCQSVGYSLSPTVEYDTLSYSDTVGVFPRISTGGAGTIYSTMYVMTSEAINVHRSVEASTTALSGTYTQPIGPNVAETYTNTGSVRKTVGERFIYGTGVIQTLNNTTQDDPAWGYESFRNTAATTVSWERSKTTAAYPVYQTVDFAGGPAGSSRLATIFSQVDYESNNAGAVATLYSQVDYEPISKGRISTLFAQVDYVAPVDRNATGSVVLQTEVEYTSEVNIGSVVLQTEWEGPPPAGDSRVPSVGMQSALTPDDTGLLNSIGIQSSLTSTTIAHVDSVGAQSSLTSTTIAHVDSIGINAALTTPTLGHVNAVYLQLAITNPQPLAGGLKEDIQGEYFKKRFNSFYKR